MRKCESWFPGQLDVASLSLLRIAINTQAKARVDDYGLTLHLLPIHHQILTGHRDRLREVCDNCCLRAFANSCEFKETRSETGEEQERGEREMGRSYIVEN